MNFRVSQFAATCGLGLLIIPGMLSGQAPRYQSPYATPAAPQPQTPALPVPAAITPNGTVVEDVIVRVNDQIVSRSDLERSQQQFAQEMQQNSVPPAEAAEQQKNLLRDMIDKELLLSRGKELGLSADAEVIRRLDEIRKQNKLDAIEDKDCVGNASCTSLEKAARQQGVSFEDFKANIRNGILTQQVVRDEVGRRLQMTQGQEQTFYEEHKQEFAQPEQVRLSEILIPTAADAKDDAVAQAQAKAADVAAQLKAGGKFDDLAKKYSGGPTASQGGDLGLFKRGALAKVLEDQTFGLPAGEATAPIRTRQGFVILKVTEHQAAGITPMKEVEGQIQEMMYMQQLQPALRAYLTKLRENAYIDIKPGFVDTGASAKQTKPVFTAYAPPVVKKKKTQEKQRFDRGGRFSTVSKTGPKLTPRTPAANAATAPTSPVTTGTAAGAVSATPETAATAAPSPATPAAGASSKAGSKKVSSPGKKVKLKREKVRFGQAPRNSLPTAPQDTAADAGLGRNDPNGPGGAAAPGAAIAPVESSTTQFAASNDPDPLAPKAVVTGKSRYSSRAKTEAATKAAAKASKQKEKALATPIAATAEEKAAEQTQAAPLGLNGDTGKKKKTKVKGAPKERLQQKPKEPAAPAPEATPYRNPDNPGAPVKTAPSSDSTTLPSVTAPVPGAPPQNGTTPSSPGSPVPTPAPN